MATSTTEVRCFPTPSLFPSNLCVCSQPVPDPAHIPATPFIRYALTCLYLGPHTFLVLVCTPALMGYVLQSHVRALVVTDAVGRVMCRSIIRLVLRSDTLTPVIFCDPMFFTVGYSRELQRDLLDQVYTRAPVLPRHCAASGCCNASSPCQSLTSFSGPHPHFSVPRPHARRPNRP